MFYANVFGHRVAAPRSAAEGERRGEFEVVDVTDGALRGRHVDDHAAGLHRFLPFGDLLLTGDGVDVQGCSVAVAAVRDQALRFGDGVVKVFGAVEREHGGELFVRERLFKLDAFDLADEDLRRVGHGEAADLGDLRGALADDLGVESAVDDHRGAHFVLFLFVEDIAAALDELRFHGVVHGVFRDDGLLGSADQAVVESLGMDDGVDRDGDVSRLVDDGGGVARADAEGGFARGVSAAHHAGAAGGEDDVCRLHQGGRHVEGRDVDPADDAFGSARLDSRFEHDLRRGDGAALCAGVRRDDDAVARFQADERLEDRRGGGVGRGDDRRDHADGLGDFFDAVRLVFLDDADRFGVLVGVIDVLGGIVVFDDFVFHDTHARFRDRHFGERDALVVRREGCRREDLVYLFLRIGGEDLLRLPDLFDLAHQRLDRIDELFVLHKTLLSEKIIFRCIKFPRGAWTGSRAMPPCPRF